jgi:hypothetical protein
MLMVRNWTKVEEYSKSLSDEERSGQNHPVVIWRDYLTSQRGQRTVDSHEQRWRHRQRAKPVNQVIQTLKRWFPGQGAGTYRSCAHEVIRDCGLAFRNPHIIDRL